jgi:hypothetical protein
MPTFSDRRPDRLCKSVNPPDLGQTRLQMDSLLSWLRKDMLDSRAKLSEVMLSIKSSSSLVAVIAAKVSIWERQPGSSRITSRLFSDEAVLRNHMTLALVMGRVITRVSRWGGGGGGLALCRSRNAWGSRGMTRHLCTPVRHLNGQKSQDVAVSGHSSG